jgi:hypothetical protein
MASPLRIIECKTCQEALSLIRHTPLKPSHMLLLLQDIEKVERDGTFDQWDIHDVKRAFLNQLYPDPVAVRERILASAQSDRMATDRAFLLRVTEMLFKL